MRTAFDYRKGGVKPKWVLDELLKLVALLENEYSNRFGPWHSFKTNLLYSNWKL